LFHTPNNTSRDTVSCNFDMKDLQLLYLDSNLKRSFFLEIFKNELNCDGIISSILFREQLSLENELSNEIRKYLDKGEIVPYKLLEVIITNKIQEFFNTRILLIGYPKTIEQLESFKIALLEENISISKSWYIKHRDFDDFKNKKFHEDETNPWFIKYGSDMEKTWTNNFLTTRQEISHLLESGLVLDTRIIELSYEESIDTDSIRNKIKNCN
jgi:adenylate kinase family enzyme